MTEEFLHYAWKYRLYEGAIKECGGKDLVILQPGKPNTNAGPDFFNAQIKIGNETWAGNVEIHLNSSDWKKHGHHKDEAYNNVILHVVFNNDLKALNTEKRSIPTLDISSYLAIDIYERYLQFLKSRTWIPCQTQIVNVDSFIISNWVDRLVVNRLQRKSGEVTRLLNITNNDWSEAFWVALARNFGFKVNAEPMERLARSLPLTALAKHKNNLLQIEALLYGQAGFLKEPSEDEYIHHLQNEFKLLSKKFKLQALPKSVWKFGRLRPPNFPTIRLAQLAQLIYQSSGLFSRILQAKTVQELSELFRIGVSDFWLRHYTFEKMGRRSEKRLGEKSVELIVMNTVIPFLFIYGKAKGSEEHCERALKFLEHLPGEDNVIIRKWKQLGMKPKTAYQTQGLLELKNEFCEQKRCLHCSIGMKLLGRNKDISEKG